MSLKPISPGLRTIHNGSNAVAKAQIAVPSGGELTVPAAVADQLQRDGAFKDGPAPAALVEAVEVEAAAVACAEAEEAARRAESFTTPVELAPVKTVAKPKAKPKK